MASLWGNGLATPTWKTCNCCSTPRRTAKSCCSPTTTTPSKNSCAATASRPESCLRTAVQGGGLEGHLGADVRKLTAVVDSCVTRTLVCALQLKYPPLRKSLFPAQFLRQDWSVLGPANACGHFHRESRAKKTLYR